MIARSGIVPAALASALLLTACNGVQSGAPAVASPSAVAPETGAANLNAQQTANRARLLAFFERRPHQLARRSQGVLPDSGPAKKQVNLLYVTDGGNYDVLMLAYPTLKQLGKITGTVDVQGVCSDPKGNVWTVPSVFPELSEYAHGVSKVKATLSDAGAQYPLTCAVDPSTGNLAMTNLGAPSGGGNVYIWTKATGTANIITDSAMSYVYFCAYDPSGNLWVDGLDSKYNFVFAELAAGSQTLKTVPLTGIVFPGGIEWDGTQLAVGDQSYQSKQTSAIDQVSTGSTPSITGTTPLNGTCDVTQFSILNGKVFAPDVCTNTGSMYAYPAGGNAQRTLKNLQYPLTTAINTLPSSK